MRGPKLAAVLTILIMLGGFAYIAWASRQAAGAYARLETKNADHVDRVERVLRSVETDMDGRNR